MHSQSVAKKIWVKNLGKCWGFVKIEFLDKNLTFRNSERDWKSYAVYCLVNFRYETMTDITIRGRLDLKLEKQSCFEVPLASF